MLELKRIDLRSKIEYIRLAKIVSRGYIDQKVEGMPEPCESGARAECLVR